jgi:hypothetical protein
MSKMKMSDISHISDILNTSNATITFERSSVPVSEAVIFARIALLLCAHVTH